MTATYGGDASFASSSGTETHTVDPALTTTTVTPAPDPSSLGQTVTFTATVAPVSPGAGTPTGTVTFFVSGGPTLTGTLGAGGVATASTAVLPPGTYTVAATYSGDVNFTGSSGTGTHTVSQAGTTTTVTSAPDPSVYCQAVTFTATVAASSGSSCVPTGTVTFVVAGGPTLTGALDGSGVATATTSALAAGLYTATATYSGDVNFTGSSGTDTHTVNQANTTMLLTTVPDSSTVGETVTLAAVVAPVPPGAGVATGTVDFVVTGGPTIIGVPLDDNGFAITDTDAIGVGTQTVTATYSGDANFTASSDTDTQTVNP
ncbi:Ig-like domain repeat protein [Streptomyces sp. 8K308]|uniref:Ig-like domain-containing protein n=1 Tax=Streptomyces sp. 8K308 TaxID=2530388 RepID=UPI00104D4854|nr:Ig-like domain-containing protein [Streptomyces sp. 8K308]TDC20740.1 Ig-like domain repeat protein [Streptomyces sp. 8K308]